MRCPYGHIEGVVDDGIGINRERNSVIDACLVDDQFANTYCSSLIDRKAI
jgi:hypothetical protein